MLEPKEAVVNLWCIASQSEEQVTNWDLRLASEAGWESGTEPLTWGVGCCLPTDSVRIELRHRTPGWRWELIGVWKAHTPGIHHEVQRLLKSRGESLCRVLAKMTDFQALPQRACVSCPQWAPFDSGIRQVQPPWEGEKMTHLSIASVLTSALPPVN